MTKSNPFHLKTARKVGTLMGGTEGHADDAKHHRSSASSAEVVASRVSAKTVQLSSDAHHALSAMIAGYIAHDRALLDSGFEDLVGFCEEMRDAVPKA